MNQTTLSAWSDPQFFTDLVRDTTARALGITPDGVNNLICGQCGHRALGHEATGACKSGNCSCTTFTRLGTHSGEVAVLARIVELPRDVREMHVIRIQPVRLGTPAVLRYIDKNHGYVEAMSERIDLISVEGELMLLRAYPVYPGYWSFAPDPHVCVIETDNPPIMFGGRLVARNLAMAKLAEASA